METDTNGLLMNMSNIVTASEIRSDVGTIIYHESYNEGEAVTCSTPGVEICRTPVYPKGTFSGTYSIGFFYDSSTATVQGTELMRFEIYEDGILLPEDTSVYAEGTVYQFDLNYVTNVIEHGLYQNFTLKANSTYQIIIKTSPNLTHDAILDYIIFEKVASNTMLWGTPKAQILGERNAGISGNLDINGVQVVSEMINGIVNNSLSSGVMVTLPYTFNTKFKSIIIALPTMYGDGDGKLTVDWDSTDYNNSQVLINIRNNSSSTWTASVSPNLRILILGYI